MFGESPVCVNVVTPGPAMPAEIVFWNMPPCGCGAMFCTLPEMTRRSCRDERQALTVP